jgi:two-component system OmpR family response regulator
MQRERVPTILVVDDEPAIVDCVATALRYEGFHTREATSGVTALACIAEHAPALIVLDWMLPDLDGIELTRYLRAHASPVPILFLSAKGAIEDKVEALRAGGDDYLTKPFGLSELVARVHALMRRSDDAASHVLTYADLTLKDCSQRVTRGHAEVALTATEFALLRLFLLNPDRTMTTSRILEDVWLNESDGSTNMVGIYMESLRRKLDAAGPPLIINDGHGAYRMIPAPTPLDRPEPKTVEVHPSGRHPDTRADGLALNG